MNKKYSQRIKLSEAKYYKALIKYHSPAISNYSPPLNNRPAKKETMSN